jgi:hypothetical protein
VRIWFFRESSVSCFYCVTLGYVLFSKNFSHRWFMILKNSWPNLLGLCHFPLNT